MLLPQIFAVLFAVQLTDSTYIKQNEADSKVVQIESGPVRGYKQEGFNVFAFYGVPYATAPTGPNKFKAPLPAPVWSETLDAVDDSIACPQYITQNLATTMKDVRMIDDCLIANIYVPDIEETNLPVVIYVHGGAYLMGFGDLMQPKSLVEMGNVIVVNLNYRLGVQGFLCLGTEDVPGNAGMKDQVALLRWVQKNIASFGGNPDDVTIAGFSAGSSAVELLAVSKMAEGLFNKVIPESGAGVAVFSIQQNPIETAKSLAESMGFKTDDVYELEKFYKNSDVKELNIEAYFERPDSTFGFVPCIERETGTESFLTEAPASILKQSEFKRLPMLIGFANMEGIFRLDIFNVFKDGMNNNFSNYLPVDLTFKNEHEREEVANVVKKFYFGDKPVTEDNLQSYIDYFTDVLFAYPALKSVRLQVEAGNDRIYLYEYSFVDDPLIANMNPYQVNGANHCAQTNAVLEYGAFYSYESMITESHKQMRAMTKQLWINFIKTGKPVPEPTTTFPEGWSPVTVNDSPYMELNMPPTLKKSLLEQRFALWDGLYDKYYRIPSPPPSPISTNTAFSFHNINFTFQIMLAVLLAVHFFTYQ